MEQGRIETIQMENYSLRKRCKRLENIVTQLLENKGNKVKFSFINQTQDSQGAESKNGR